MPELIVFVHGMANFAHNRVSKKCQEQLVCAQIGARHKFIGAFDDSGNFAFVTPHSSSTLQADILAALRQRCDVKGAVVIDRTRVANALSDLENIARAKYGNRFQAWDYTVWKNSERWKLGFVFLDMGTGLNLASTSQLLGFQNTHMEVLSVQGNIVGVLKFDPEKPRVPWGVPASDVASVVAGGTSSLVATGRSARTIRGILRIFQHFRHP